MRRRFTYFLLGLMLMGCVKIETGPASREIRSDSARSTARSLETEWGTRFNQATPIERLDILRLVVDSVGASYHRYGQQVVEQWQDAEKGRRQQVPASEMLAQVEKWNELQAPVFRAYENVMEYGVESIRKDALFDQTTMDQITGYRDMFYDLYNAVFYPAGNVADYQERVEAAKITLERRSRDLEREAGRYR